MDRLCRGVQALVNDRWLVFVCAMWVQSCAGVGYLFGGSMSPAIKTALGYDQKQVSLLGVAKNLGDAVGFVSGALSEVSPAWVVLLVGAVQNFVGYGLVWLVVAGLLPNLPLWMMFIFIFVGTNGETYYNTAALVSCVRNFPENRGPVVGILKGFSGLSGAILTQIYLMFNSPNDSSVILMVALGPPLIVLALMFIVRPVEGGQPSYDSTFLTNGNRPSDDSRFLITYGFCVVLAAYLFGVLLIQDLVDLSRGQIVLFGVILIVLMLLLGLVPFASVEPRTQLKEQKFLIEDENEKSQETSLFLESEMRKRGNSPRIGEDFTLLQALLQADFWLVFLSLVLGTGSGITVIDNLGQVCYSLGYNNTKLFVSMVSIFNFLGRVGGGFFSEKIMRKFALPRLLAMAMIQAIMAVGLLYYTIGGPGKMYVVTVLIGLGYGAHWGIAPASVSDLFGLKSFGSLYNFLILALPAGSFIFSGIIASNIYDYYAKKQVGPGKDEPLTCVGSVCYSLVFGIMSGICVVAMVLSLVVVYRTRRFYCRSSEKSLNQIPG